MRKYFWSEIIAKSNTPKILMGPLLYLSLDGTLSKLTPRLSLIFLFLLCNVPTKVLLVLPELVSFS